MAHLVYPGALHTRFHHALGAFHLLIMAIDNLRTKGVELSDKEAEAASIAALLHDTGHGPFSHALEALFIEDVSHEEVSRLFMEKLNEEYDGKLELALEVFDGRYHRPFLHQLVSSQLDVDRLDYLRRDSFYTGVSEGSIGSDRIIMMMDVRHDELVIEEKGIYSIEKFLLARRFMYWQVYFHKTAVSAEQLLLKILKRAKELALQGIELFATPAFSFFLYQKISKNDFRANSKVLDTFARLDDNDVMASVKTWMDHPDAILSILCRKIINRDLYKIEFQDTPPEAGYVAMLKQKAIEKFGVSEEEADYFVITDSVENRAYSSESTRIKILLKNGQTKDIADVSDRKYLAGLDHTITKHFVCYPKELVQTPEEVL
jgi:hypothetical protein